MENSAFINHIKEKNPHQPTFYQAVEEVLESIKPVLENDGRR